MLAAIGINPQWLADFESLRAIFIRQKRPFDVLNSIGALSREMNYA
jgi:hypothetical protein